LSLTTPAAELEAQIVSAETGLDASRAAQLVKIAHAARQLKGHGLTEGISTRLLVYAATLIMGGVAPRDACRMALVRPITDDADIRQTLDHTLSQPYWRNSPLRLAELSMHATRPERAPSAVTAPSADAPVTPVQLEAWRQPTGLHIPRRAGRVCRLHGRGSSTAQSVWP
jgi:hypothetical protein